MRTQCMIAAVLLAWYAPTALAQDYAKYLWEFPEAASVTLPADKHWMLDDLRLEVDKILAAGHLAPYYFNACDLHHEGYFLYVEPGRIITTLAWAYPHLPASQQARVKEYVVKELANPKYAPWAGGRLPWDGGTGREGLGKPAGFNFDRWWSMEGRHRPCLHTLYGLWLYGHRSGDWRTVKAYWPQIKPYYASTAATAEVYGEFAAHIAMARLSSQFADQPMENTAVAVAEKCFAAGRDYAAVEQTSLRYFNRLKERRHNYLHSTQFMLLNLSPEVGRFLRDNAREPVLRKNEAIKRAYLHWWFIAPPYASWAGNIGPDCEGIGLPREVFGMIFPVERWVAETKADSLAVYMSSGPDGLGDCYWLEPLVWTIEAYGQTTWMDVRKRRPM